jgi:hypothetical protein
MTWRTRPPGAAGPPPLAGRDQDRRNVFTWAPGRSRRAVVVKLLVYRLRLGTANHAAQRKGHREGQRRTCQHRDGDEYQTRHGDPPSLGPSLSAEVTALRGTGVRPTLERDPADIPDLYPIVTFAHSHMESTACHADEPIFQCCAARPRHIQRCWCDAGGAAGANPPRRDGTARTWRTARGGTCRRAVPRAAPRETAAREVHEPATGAQGTGAAWAAPAADRGRQRCGDGGNR